MLKKKIRRAGGALQRRPWAMCPLNSTVPRHHQKDRSLVHPQAVASSHLGAGVGTGLSWGPSPSPAQGGEGNRTQQQPRKFSSCSRTKRELRRVILWRRVQQLGGLREEQNCPERFNRLYTRPVVTEGPRQFRAAPRAPCNPLPVLCVCALGPTVRGGPGSPLHRVTASGFRVLTHASALGSAGRYSEVLPPLVS